MFEALYSTTIMVYLRRGLLSLLTYVSSTTLICTLTYLVFSVYIRVHTVCAHICQNEMEYFELLSLPLLLRYEYVSTLRSVPFLPPRD